MKAYTTLFSFFFLFTGAFAQNGMAIHHFTCQMELGGGAEKFMLEELLAIDPNAHVSIDQGDGSRSRPAPKWVNTGFYTPYSAPVYATRPWTTSPHDPNGPVNSVTSPCC
ncbi:MAG: hypothetical protein IPO56_15855 [Flavobacteriales bacterium]|nr:hypothetical protein [Flavobacteriales bacterium]